MSDPILVRRAIGTGADPEHAAVRIETGAFGPWQTNAYLLWDGQSRDALVVDPGMGAAEPLVERSRALGLSLHVIADSHGHIDHVFDNAALARATGAPIGIHPDDAYRLAGGSSLGFGLEASEAREHLTEGRVVTVGTLEFVVMHTPGHTEGSVCLHERRHGILLSGDTLFRGSWGRTDLPGGDDRQMFESLMRLAREVPGESRVLPGHGPETTVTRERSWLERMRRIGRLVI